MRIAWPMIMAILAIAFVAQAHSPKPPGSEALKNDGCGPCHGTQATPAIVIDMKPPAAYLAAASHRLTLTSDTDVQRMGENAGGFMVWASHGSFALRPESDPWYTIDDPPLSNGTHWIGHNFTGNWRNEGQRWSFDWIPPTTDVGPIKMFVFVARVNGANGNDAGDHWNRRHFLVESGTGTTPPPTTPSSSPLPVDTDVFSDPAPQPDGGPGGARDPIPGWGVPAAATAVVVGVWLYRRR